jgi:Gluconate 2-dehydrogenase subunit 3
MPFRSPDQRAVTPQGRGRFPGFDVLDQVPVWDDVTAGVVLARLALPGSLAFFTPAEVAVAAPLLDLLLGQDGDPRVPVLELIDIRLASGETDGWHYDDLPEDGAAWRATLAALEADARTRFDRGFGELPPAAQAGLIQAVQAATHSGGQWHGHPAPRVWSLWTRYACAAFYSHPWAWNEIGFSGPAYPRGYLNIGVDARDNWEVSEHHPIDPVPFAARVEQAQSDHTDLVGGSS